MAESTKKTTTPTTSTTSANGSLKVTTATGTAYGIKDPAGEFVNGKMRYMVSGPYTRVLRQGAKNSDGATPFDVEQWLAFLSTQGEVNPQQAMLDLSVAQWNTESRNTAARKLEDAYNATHIDPAKAQAKAEKTYAEMTALRNTAAGQAAEDAHLKKILPPEAYAAYRAAKDAQAATSRQGK